MGEKIWKHDSYRFRNRNLLNFCDSSWHNLGTTSHASSCRNTATKIPRNPWVPQCFALTPTPIIYSKRNAASIKVLMLRTWGIFSSPLSLRNYQKKRLLNCINVPSKLSLCELEVVAERQKLGRFQCQLQAPCPGTDIPSQAFPLRYTWEAQCVCTLLLAYLVCSCSELRSRRLHGGGLAAYPWEPNNRLEAVCCLRLLVLVCILDKVTTDI